jgi:hypothetical protein
MLVEQVDGHVQRLAKGSDTMSVVGSETRVLLGMRRGWMGLRASAPDTKRSMEDSLILAAGVWPCRAGEKFCGEKAEKRS